MSCRVSLVAKTSGDMLSRFSTFCFTVAFCTFFLTPKQHPKDTPANAPLTKQSQDHGDIAPIELDPASAARADLSGITMQQVCVYLRSFETLNCLLFAACVPQVDV